MATLEDVIKKNETFICDSCQKTFKAKDVILEEVADNINIVTPLYPFIFIDKHGIITGGKLQPKKELGDKVFACPHCKSVHLFGFHLHTEYETSKNSIKGPSEHKVNVKEFKQWLQNQINFFQSNILNREASYEIDEAKKNILEEVLQKYDEIF
jgi:hypothetical protein